MKKLTAVLIVFVVGGVFALDNEDWLAKARECAESGFFLDSDETKEDGVYCIALAPISKAENKSVTQKVGEAELEAKSKLTAYVHGETVSASRSVESGRTTVSEDGEKASKSFSRFQKKIEKKRKNWWSYLKLQRKQRLPPNWMKEEPRRVDALMHWFSSRPSPSPFNFLSLLR